MAVRCVYGVCSKLADYTRHLEIVESYLYSREPQLYKKSDDTPWSASHDSVTARFRTRQAGMQMSNLWRRCWRRKQTMVCLG